MMVTDNYIRVLLKEMNAELVQNNKDIIELEEKIRAIERIQANLSLAKEDLLND